MLFPQQNIGLLGVDLSRSGVILTYFYRRNFIKLKIKRIEKAIKKRIKCWSPLALSAVRDGPTVPPPPCFVRGAVMASRHSKSRATVGQPYQMVCEFQNMPVYEI